MESGCVQFSFGFPYTIGFFRSRDVALQDSFVQFSVGRGTANIRKKNLCRRFGWSELHARLNCTERFKYSGGVHAVSSDYTHRSFSAAMTLKFVIIARCALRAVLNIEKM